STGQPLANFSAQQINTNEIMTTLRNDDVCMTLRRLDKLHVHGPNRPDVLFDNRIERAPALGKIPPQAANETNVVGRVDKNLDVHLLEQTRLGEDQNPFEDDNRFRFDCARLVQARVGFEVVKRQLDRFAGLESTQM